VSETEATGDSEGGLAAVPKDVPGVDERTDQFTVDMMSAWGDQWIWSDVESVVAQEVYKMLGQPDVFTKVGGGPRRHGEVGAIGGELGAE
jgi:hypothetical protein